MKNSLGLNPGQGARERKRRKEQEKVEEQSGGGRGDRLYSFPVTGKNDPRGSGNGEAGSETS